MKNENLYSPQDEPPVITPGVAPGITPGAPSGIAPGLAPNIPLNVNREENIESVEPLPESSRPRRDGPGGDEAQ